MEGTSSQEMKIAIKQFDEEAVIRLSGRLDMNASPDFGRAVLALFLKGKCKNLTIDLSGVPLIDTSGLATLMEILVMAGDRSVQLVFVGLNERLRYLIEVNGLTGFFKIGNPVQEKSRA